MNGKQTVVGAGGVGLLLVNFWTGPAREAINAGTGAAAGKKQIATAHRELVHLGAALLLVAGAAILAGVSDTFASAMVAVILGLWALWAINRFGA